MVLTIALLAGTLVALTSLSSSRAKASAGTTSLYVGETLSEGQSLVDGSLSAVMQSDGNFVLYNGSKPIWASNTGRPSDPGYRLVMQGDGNLVMYTPANVPVWATGSSGSNAFLVLQADGNMVLYSDPPAGYQAVWASGTYSPTGATTTSAAPTTTTTTSPPPPVITTTLSAGQTLLEGQALVNGTLTALLQHDGNFVIYHSNSPIWASGTGRPGDPGYRLVMQGDGNLVLYTPGNVPVWATGTSGLNAFLVLQADGNMVLYDDPPSGPRPVWASGSSIPLFPSTVGVYAYPTASQALADGWRIIADTGALGTPSAPWTGYNSATDANWGAAIQQSNPADPWLSFWTVSAPAYGSYCTGLISSASPIASSASVLGTNGSLGEGQSIVSPNQRAQLVMQIDGNLVLYTRSSTSSPWSAIWSTATSHPANGAGPFHLVMQADGNLVIYNAASAAVWSSGSCITSATTPAPYLVMQNDGNLVAYDNNATPIWSYGGGAVRPIAQPADFYAAGYAAGRYVAQTISNYGLSIKPSYEILDPEGYPDEHSCLDAIAGTACWFSNASYWSQMMAGWAAGLNTVAGMHPAFYATQSEYLVYNLAAINQPFFVAVAFGSSSPTSLDPPIRLNGVNGSNIVGVSAFYSGVSASLECSSVVAAANNIANWGYPLNTLQFDPGLRCPA
jgi:hypothetical protein